MSVKKILHSSIYDRLGVLLLIALLWYPPIDPDLFWHLGIGEILWHGQSIWHDTFSYTMQHYAWIDHEWLTDAIMYGLYSAGGYVLLALPFIACFLGAFIVASRIQTEPRTEKTRTFIQRLFPIIIALFAARSVLGTRPQMISILGFALVYTWCSDLLAGKRKHLWHVPLFFLLWANLHGGFTAGLLLIVLFCISLVCEILFAGNTSYHQLRHLIVIGTLSTLITLINPYTLRLWEEIIHATLLTPLNNELIEWGPPNFQLSSMLPFLGYILIVVISLIFRSRPLTNPLRWSILIAPFFILALSVTRHIPFFIIITLPLLRTNTEQIDAAQKVSSFSPTEKPLSFLAFSWLLNTSLAILAATLVIYTGGIYLIASLSPRSNATLARYPLDALQYFTAHSLQGHVLNYYNWGGYIDWQTGGLVPVFIDGRMASWTTADRNVFRDYLSITSLSPGYEELIEKYIIVYALLPANKNTSTMIQQSNQWYIIYKDTTSVLLQRSDL
jgi:hypothetical protein